MVSVLSAVAAPWSVTGLPNPEEAFKKLDTGNKGYLISSDLASIIVQISEAGSQLSQQVVPHTEEAFKKMDANQDGKISMREFGQAVSDAKVEDHKKQSAPGGKPSGEGGTTGVGSSETQYALADANKDGVVTALEQLTYDAKHVKLATIAGLANASLQRAAKRYQSLADTSRL
jgi:hypothetical protein